MASPLAPVSLDYARIGSSLPKSALTQIRDPPGFVKAATGSKQGGKAVAAEGRPTLSTIRTKRAFDLAFSPAKNIPMQGFMMWMAGNSVQIFSMMSIFTTAKGSIQGMLNVNKTFAHLAVAPLPNASTLTSQSDPPADTLLPQKAIYVICQAALLALALYKCHSMGLLPTSSSDWLAFREPPIALEYSAASMI